MVRRRTLGLKTANTKTLNDVTPLECRILAYYLYVIYNYKLQFDSDNETDEDFVTLFYNLFGKLAKKLKQEEAIEIYLNNEISRFVKQGLLTPIETVNGELSFFEKTQIPILLQEDKEIERIMIYNSSFCRSLLSINLLRCQYVLHSNKFMLNLITNFLINKTPSKEVPLMEKMPKYLEAALKDTGNFEFVKNAVKLSPMELKLLQCCYRCYTNMQLVNILNTFTNSCKAEIFSRLIGISNREYNALIRKDSKLKLYGFLDDEGSIGEDFFECIDAGSMEPFFYDLLKKADSKDCYELESFNVPENSRNIMSRMLCSNENFSFLLYGKPGSGKTEFAKSLVGKNNLQAYIFKNERELYEDNKTNVLSRLYCLLSMESKDCVYIIDEADSLLATKDLFVFFETMKSPKKGTVNKMLEESHNKIIWIVNETKLIDESTLRRFTYSFKFDAMTRKQLRSIAESKLKPLALPKEINNQILKAMEDYNVTGASVDNVLKTIKCLGEGEELLQSIKSVLKENALLLSGKNCTRETVDQNYDLSVLNTSMKPEQIVRMVKNAAEFSEQAGFDNDVRNGIRMLFYGESGTGKTELARYIAEQLEKKILIKRPSDILDSFVGVNEKNVRDAFEEASRSGSILLFDEADSFFTDRNMTRLGWERRLVNEFLVQMEVFNGILICTTNLKNLMDSAMNRRFHIITEFKPLTAAGIKVLLNKYFGQLEFANSDISRLEKMLTITPGDFGVLSSRFRFLDKSDRTSSYVIEELYKIQKEKQGSHNTMGFVGY